MLDSPVSELVLDTTFEAMWPNFQAVLDEVSKMPAASTPAQRETVDVLEEIASGVKALLARDVTVTGDPFPSFRPNSFAAYTERKFGITGRPSRTPWVCARGMVNHDKTVCENCGLPQISVGEITMPPLGDPE